MAGTAGNYAFGATVASSSIPEDEGRRDGPKHDGDTVIDSQYEQGRWETLSLSEAVITMVGCSPHPMDASNDVQGGMFLMARGVGRNLLYTVMGGGP